MILRAKLGAFLFALFVLVMATAGRNASAVTLYWDNDANAANNNTTTGAGLGGVGTWDASSLKWFDGSADVAWTNGNDAVFTGTGGNVSLGAAQSVNSLSFKANNYVVQNNTITLGGPVNVDSGI